MKKFEELLGNPIDMVIVQEDGDIEYPMYRVANFSSKLAKRYRGKNTAKWIAEKVEINHLRDIRHMVALSLIIEYMKKDCTSISDEEITRATVNPVQFIWYMTDSRVKDIPLYKDFSDLDKYIKRIESVYDTLCDNERASNTNGSFENFVVMVMANVLWYLPTLAFGCYVFYEKAVNLSVETNAFLAYMLMVIFFINTIALCCMYHGFPRVYKGKRVK